MALAVIVKGPIGPHGVRPDHFWRSACGIEKPRWMREIGWGWGLILVAAVSLPWAMAITVATDGAFWAAAVGRDMAAKLVGGAEGHGAPPGFYLVTLPLLLFPFCLLLPAAAVTAWRERATPWVRFALCWLDAQLAGVRGAPTKLVHYPLPLYAALCWLLAGALDSAAGPPRAVGRGGVAAASAPRGSSARREHRRAGHHPCRRRSWRWRAWSSAPARAPG